MASNETKNPRRAQMRGPGGPGGAMTGEKAKDFKHTIKPAKDNARTATNKITSGNREDERRK